MKALDKALDVLDLLMDKGTAGVTEISKDLNLNKNNVFRILVTLEEHGLVEKDEDTDKYKLSKGCVVLGHEFFKQNLLMRVALPSLKTLKFKLGESINLAMVDDKREFIVYVASEETIKPVKVKPREGRRFGLGSHTSSAKALSNALKGEEGLVFADEYDEENAISGGACVIRDHSDKPVGAVEVIAPIYRMPLEKVNKEVRPLLEETALDISRGLGYEG